MLNHILLYRMINQKVLKNAILIIPFPFVIITDQIVSEEESIACRVWDCDYKRPKNTSQHLQFFSDNNDWNALKSFKKYFWKEYFLNTFLNCV